MMVTLNEGEIHDKGWIWVLNTVTIILNSYCLFRLLKGECTICFNVMRSAENHRCHIKSRDSAKKAGSMAPKISQYLTTA